jgi:hypothetical protein
MAIGAGVVVGSPMLLARRIQETGNHCSAFFSKRIRSDVALACKGRTIFILDLCLPSVVFVAVCLRPDSYSLPVIFRSRPRVCENADNFDSVEHLSSA